MQSSCHVLRRQKKPLSRDWYSRKHWISQRTDHALEESEFKRLVWDIQKMKVKKPRKMESSIDFGQFRSLRAALSCICHSRPDMCYSANCACQASEALFSAWHIKFLRKVTIWAKETKELYLTYRLVDRDTLHLHVYSDGWFGTNAYHSSNSAYLILLASDKENCHIVAYSRKKSKSVVRSIMAGEVFTFSEVFDQALAIQHDPKSILRTQMSPRCLRIQKNVLRNH